MTVSSRLVYRQPARKTPAQITDEVHRKVLEGLKHTSQHKLSRELGLSQSTISRIKREADDAQ